MELDAGLTPYELRVKRNIEENQRMLRSLGLLTPSFERKESIKKTVRKSNVTVKRKSSFWSNDESPALPARRTRRSSSLLKSQGYDEDDDVPVAAEEENTPPHKRKKIAPEPVFGPIEGVTVGDWWSTRIECSAAGVHRPTVAGIHGKLGEGCYSIALSGGYEDDVDYGECFTYTGSGGRDLKGTKTNPKNLRTAPQTKDQVLEGPNAALALNIENHRPVRVIRGYKLPSPYAPEEGYRYDGLYSVERCWTATGLSGFNIYKFALKRLPDQDPPPWVTNGSIIPAQNGHGESTEDGPLEEENNSNNHSKTRSITPDSACISTSCLKSSSKCSPFLEKNIENNEEVTLTENNPQIVSKGKRTSSVLKLKSEETNEESSSIDSVNSSRQIQGDDDDTIKQIQVTPERNIRLSNSKINSEASVKESECATDSLNLNQNILEGKDETEKQSQVTLKRKRTSGNAFANFLYAKETLKDSKSPEGSLNSMQNLSEDEDENELQTEMTPKKTRLSSSSKLDPEETKQEPKYPANTLNSVHSVADEKDENNVQEMTRRLLMSNLNHQRDFLKSRRTKNSPNSPKNSSANDETEEQIQMTPKIKKIPSTPKLDSEGTKEIPESPSDSLNSAQNISDAEVVTKRSRTQVTLKRNRQSSSSKPDTEGTLQESKSLSDSLSSVEHVSDNSGETGEQTHMTSKRKKMPSTPKLGPEGAKQKPDSPIDPLNSMQNVLDKDASDKLTQMSLERRPNNPNPDSAVTVQESNSSNCTNARKINKTNKHSDIDTSVDIDRLNYQGKLEKDCVNCLKLNEKSNDLENSKVSPCNTQIKQTDHMKVENVARSPIFSCQVQLTPLSGKYLNCETVNLNSSQTETTKRKSTGSSPNSTDKKVRFSPEVIFNYVEGKKCTVKNIPISSLDSENQNSACKLDYPSETWVSVEPIKIYYPQEKDQTGLQSPPINSDSESKKQTSILKYFGPAKKVEDKRVSSRGILLRSNRRSVVSNNFLPVSESKCLKSGNIPVTNSPSPQAKSEVLKASSKQKSAQSRQIVKAVSAKRNCHSSSDKTEKDVFKALEKADHSIQKKETSSSPVKPCSVSLFRLNITQKSCSVRAAYVDGNQLEDPFLGWDWSFQEVEFLGFDSSEEHLFNGFEENSEHLKDFMLMRSVIEKMSEAL